jgi:hypothetical protein
LAREAAPRYKTRVKTKKRAARKTATKPRSRPAAARTVKERAVPAGERRSFDGGCHCGAIEYTYTTTLSPARWPVRLCQCSFCRGHGSRATSDAAGELQFRFERPEFLRRYRFALRTADFLICKECGVYVGAVLLSGRGAQGLVNLNTLRAPPKGLKPGKSYSHDGESVEERRGRRVQTWTPVVGPV